MLSPELEASHANDAVFGVGRSGAVGNPGKCSAASGDAANLAHGHERVLGPSTHEAAILFYVGPQEHGPSNAIRETGPTGGSGQLSGARVDHQSGPPYNGEISVDGPVTEGDSPAAGSPQISQAQKLQAVFLREAVIAIERDNSVF